MILPPGTYTQLVTTNTNYTLVSGLYVYTGIGGPPSATLTIDLANAAGDGSGETIVCMQNSSSFGIIDVVAGSPADVCWEMAPGSPFSANPGATFRGTIYVPTNTANVTNATVFGAIYAGSEINLSNTSLTYVPHTVTGAPAFP